MKSILLDCDTCFTRPRFVLLVAVRTLLTNERLTDRTLLSGIEEELEWFVTSKTSLFVEFFGRGKIFHPLLFLANDLIQKSNGTKDLSVIVCVTHCNR